MQQISPYQITPQEGSTIQYVIQQQQPQQGQHLKVLSSAMIPQQQSYDPVHSQQSSNQIYNSFDNSFSQGPKSPYLVAANANINPQQVLQYSTSPGQNKVLKQVQYVQSNGQNQPAVKVQYTDRINEGNDDRFRLSNISSIQQNGSAYGHSRKTSDRISINSATLHSQIVQPGASQMINHPQAAYNQQYQIHEQQKQKLSEFQNKQAPVSLNQTFVSYQKNEDNEQRLRSLIKENEQLIKENEYYKKYLQGVPREQQNNISLQKQVEQLSQQNESLQVQLQIQRDEAAMWINREKEINDRCQSLYDQLQMVKSGDAASIASQNQQLKQKLFDSEQNSKYQARQIEELNACLQVYKDSMKNQGIFGVTTQATQQQNTGISAGIELTNGYKDQKSNSAISVNDYIPLNQQYYSSSSITPIQPLSQQNYQQSSESNNYAYSSPKQREDMVQSIIKQYKLGSGSLSGTPSNRTGANTSTFGQRKNDEYSYSSKPIGGQNDILSNHDQKMGDWKQKYDSLTQKLNSLTGQDSTPNKQIQ